MSLLTDLNTTPRQSRFIPLDGRFCLSTGPSGNFAAGDERFWSAPALPRLMTPRIRVIYDTADGNIYYDADGDGSGAAILFATLPARPTLVATDISVRERLGRYDDHRNAGRRLARRRNGHDTLSGGGATTRWRQRRKRQPGRRPTATNSLLRRHGQRHAFRRAGDDYLDGRIRRTTMSTAATATDTPSRAHTTTRARTRWTVGSATHLPPQR